MCDCKDLTKYDYKSPAMRAYLGTYGPHFCKKLCEDAVKLMRDRNGAKVEVRSKEEVNEILKAQGISLKNNMLYDAVYVYAMGVADYWGSSITDNAHLALFVKDYIDDEDGYEGIAFHRWYADMCKKGIVFDWEDYL